MILFSLGHALLLGALVSGGAVLVARVLRSHGRDERWVWAGALLGAAVLPALLRFLPEPSSLFPAASTGGAVPEGEAWLAELPGLVAGPGAPEAAWLAPILLGVWGLASGIMGLRLVVGLVVLHRLRRRSSPVEGSELPLRRTEDAGPAIVGFVRPAILLPEWVLRLPRTYRDWIVRHEAEHLQGRDPMLLAVVLATRIAVPWNPFVWLLGRRLQAAIEIDCDRRTMGVRTSPALIESYAEALLRVARGPGRPLPAAAFAFAEPRLPLEERIRSMTTPQRPVSTTLRLALAGLAIAVLGLACELPTPNAAEEETPDPSAASVAEEEPDAADQEHEAVFTPMTQRPEIRNREEVSRALDDAYPDELREAGIGGQVIVWFYINAQGQVQETRVAEESGHPELDRAALEVARTFQFEPARNRDEPVAVWVRFPVSFRTR